MASPFDTEMLSAIEPLCEAGFALHWLHPKTKRPIGAEWSTAPRQDLAKLRQTYSPGNNLGVRLGEPSRLDCGYFLHALDLDIRIPDLAEEAWSALRDLLPDVDLSEFPRVISGSGGESRHIYFITRKPYFGKKLAVSEGKHRGSDGTWHYDWEIEMFGTGKQVALPPSIHPVTGKPYVWETEVNFDELLLGGGPIIGTDAIEALKIAEIETYDYESREPLTFKPGQFDRIFADLDDAVLDDYHQWIMVGQALHHQFGASKEGFDFWVAQSRRSDKFSDKILRSMRQKWRGFGRNRRQPVTMATLVQWAGEARIARLAEEFDDLDDEFDDLQSLPSRAETPANPPKKDDFLDDASQDDEFGALLSESTVEDDLAAFDLKPEEQKQVEAANWTSLFDYNEDGGLRPTLHNLELILRHDPRFAGVAQLNDFTHEVVQRTPPGIKAKRRKGEAKPTKQLDGAIWQINDKVNGELWSEDRDFSIRALIEAPKTQGGYGMKVSDRDLKAAVALSANQHAFHPVREYLDGLKWDGVPRAERLWIDYVNAKDDAYHRQIAKMTLVAGVTRIYEPGHKFDFATILEGLQGKRKSTLIETMGRRWFAELNGDFHDNKQMVELMQGAWIMEIPELTGFGRADVRAIKAFISAKKDKVRLAYARRAGEYPRQVVFLGSTNDDQYLRDDTGGRRFWPVKCSLDADSEIDTDRLDREMDQIWAEAVVIYREMRAAQPRGTLPLYLTNVEARETAAKLQESRRIETASDSLAGRIADWLEKPIVTGDFGEDTSRGPQYRNEVCTLQIWVECLGKDAGSWRGPEQAAINNAMAKVPGWASDGSQMRFAHYGKQRAFYRGGEKGRLERLGMG